MVADIFAGYEVARRLRARHPDSLPRLIAMSGWGEDDHRKQAQAAGFTQYLVKPVSGQTLKTAITRRAR
jgi:CheY-like chemotaxis protein